MGGAHFPYEVMSRVNSSSAARIVMNKSLESERITKFDSLVHMERYCVPGAIVPVGPLTKFALTRALHTWLSGDNYNYSAANDLCKNRAKRSNH